METEFSALLGGRTVDLRTAAELSRFFRDDVMRSAVLQHARSEMGHLAHAKAAPMLDAERLYPERTCRRWACS